MVPVAKKRGTEGANPSCPLGRSSRHIEHRRLQQKQGETHRPEESNHKYEPVVRHLVDQLCIPRALYTLTELASQTLPRNPRDLEELCSILMT